jgi:hypothetical protein
MRGPRIVGVVPSLHPTRPCPGPGFASRERRDVRRALSQELARMLRNQGRNLWRGRAPEFGFPGAVSVTLTIRPSCHQQITVQRNMRYRSRPQAAIDRPLPEAGARQVTPALVRDALGDLHHLSRLARSPLASLCVAAEARDEGRCLQRRLIEVIDEIAESRLARDGEAGRVLRAYYVKKIGSQEAVAERLHLARATFYRRLHRGWSLLAERLDQTDGISHTA